MTDWLNDYRHLTLPPLAKGAQGRAALRRRANMHRVDNSQLSSDYLTRKHTAFRSFDEMLNADGYRPTLRSDGDQIDELADRYDNAQRARGDSRRAYRGN